MEALTVKLIKLNQELLDIDKNSPVITRKHSMKKRVKNFYKSSMSQIDSGVITPELITDYCALLDLSIKLNMISKDIFPSYISVTFCKNEKYTSSNIRINSDDGMYHVTYSVHHYKLPVNIKIDIVYRHEDDKTISKTIETKAIYKDHDKGTYLFDNTVNEESYDALIYIMTIGVEAIVTALKTKFNL